MEALEHVGAAAQGGATLAQLKARWPRRARVDTDTIPETAIMCQREPNGASPYPHNQLCSGKSRRTLARCVTSWNPMFGDGWGKWIVKPPSETPNWEEVSGFDAAKDGTTWKLQHSGPASRMSGDCEGENCKEGPRRIRQRFQMMAGDYETLRSRQACEHLDSRDLPTSEAGAWLTLKVPQSSMEVGILSACGEGLEHAAFKLRVAGKISNAVTAKGDDYGNDGECVTIARGLSNAHDAWVGIKCGQDECTLDYFIVQ